MAAVTIEVYRQRIAEWSERLRTHLLQLHGASATNEHGLATTGALVAEVVRELEQMQRSVMVEIDLLNQRYQHEISTASFWRRPFLQRKQASEEAPYREVILLIERVLLAAGSITETVSTLSAFTAPQTTAADSLPVSEEQTTVEALEAAAADEATSESETVSDSEPRAEDMPPDDDNNDTEQAMPGLPPDEQLLHEPPLHEPSLHEPAVLEQRLRELALHWKWRLDTARDLLDSSDLSLERIAYIRGIQTTAWNILQDLSELLDDDSFIG